MVKEPTRRPMYKIEEFKLNVRKAMAHAKADSDDKMKLVFILCEPHMKEIKNLKFYVTLHNGDRREIWFRKLDNAGPKKECAVCCPDKNPVKCHSLNLV